MRPIDQGSQNGRVDYLRLRPSEFRREIARMPLAYLPLGTLEWHGEHLPLGADALQAHSFFMAAAAEIGGVVLPPLFLGPDIRDEETGLIGMDACPARDGSYPPQQLDGSAYWVADDTFCAMLEATLAQLARAGFQAVVAHGHGPSTRCFGEHQAEWSDRFGLKLLHLWNELGDSGLGFMVDHAAANETSLMLALHPDLVDMAAISAEEPPVGVWGEHPSLHASADRGQAIVAAQIAWLAERVRSLFPESVSTESGG